jgi:L-amino acid N-acyltransferase YncA
MTTATARPLHVKVTPDRLPSTISINGVLTRFRLLTPGDRARILEFGRAQPTDDLLMLRRDIADPADVAQWLAEIANGTTTTVIASDADSKIQGYASLARSTLRWTRHVAEIRALVTAAHRGRGLGRALLGLAFELGLESGVSKLIAQMSTDQLDAQRLFRSLGFEPEAVLRCHVMDSRGWRRDLQVMSFDTTRHALQGCEDCGALGVTRLPFAGRQLCWSCYEQEYGELGLGG